MKKEIRIKISDSHFIQDYLKKIEKKLNEKYSIVYTDNPDYLICGCFDDDYLKYDCVKIQILGENVTPEFNFVDYAMGFDFIEYEDRYRRCPLYVLYDTSFNAALHKHERSDEYFMEKKDFCNFVYSNGKWCDNTRLDLFYNISKYKKVDSGGKLLNNIGHSVENKVDFMERYKFSIACENSRKNGYTTEKIIDAFAAGTIPIYWGNPLIVKDFNPRSFINAMDFNSYDGLVEHIREIDNNDQLYLEMQHEPIFKEDSECLKYSERDEVFDFLCYIFDQPLDKARRIYNWNTGFNSEYRKYVEWGLDFTMACKKPIRKLRKLINH